MLLFSFIVTASLLQAQNKSSSSLATDPVKATSANMGTIVATNQGIPNSRVTLGAIKESGFVSTSQLASVDSVFAEWITPSGETINLAITGFTVVYQPNKGDAIAFYRKGPAINGELKERLIHATPVSKIIIGNVKANTSEGNVSVGKTLVLEVK